MKKYTLIEHTADIGIKVKAKDLKKLFKNAAQAMFEIIAERQHLGAIKQEKTKIEQKADNIEELFINWLNELLSLSATKEIIFSDFKIDRLEEDNLEATVIGGNIKNYKVNTEIKAATYHQLEIKKVPSGWEAKVIFDV